MTRNMYPSLFALLFTLPLASTAQTTLFEAQPLQTGTSAGFAAANGPYGWMVNRTRCTHVNPGTMQEAFIVSGEVTGISPAGDVTWAIPVNGGAWDLYPMPDSSWLGTFRYHEQFGNVEWFLNHDIVRFTPQGTVLWQTSLDVMSLDLNAPAVISPTGTGSILLASGESNLSTNGELEMTELDASGTLVASLQVSSPIGKFHDMLPATGHVVYAAGDSGLALYAAAGSFSRVTPRPRPVKWLWQTAPDVLLFADELGLYRCDTLFTLLDSVQYSQPLWRVYEQGGSIWRHSQDTVWQVHPSLSTQQAHAHTAIYSSGINISGIAVRDGHILAAGQQRSAAWKTYDLSGNTLIHGTDIELQRLEIMQAQYTWVPSPGIYSTQAVFEVSVLNTGSTVVDSLVVDYTPLPVPVGGFSDCTGFTHTTYQNLNLQPGDSVVFTLTTNGASYTLPPAASISCYVYAPNGLVEANTGNQSGYAQAPLIVSRPEPTATTLTLSPNPARDQVTLHSSAPLRSFTLCDLHGRFLRSGDLSGLTGELRVEDLPAGLYILLAETQDGQTLRQRLEVLR